MFITNLIYYCVLDIPAFLQTHKIICGNNWMPRILISYQQGDSPLNVKNDHVWMSRMIIVIPNFMRTFHFFSGGVVHLKPESHVSYGYKERDFISLMSYTSKGRVVRIP